VIERGGEMGVRKGEIDRRGTSAQVEALYQYAPNVSNKDTSWLAKMGVEGEREGGMYKLEPEIIGPDFPVHMTRISTYV
jgi:hypothetical protein